MEGRLLDFLHERYEAYAKLAHENPDLRSYYNGRADSVAEAIYRLGYSLEYEGGGRYSMARKVVA